MDGLPQIQEEITDVMIERLLEDIQDDMAYTENRKKEGTY